MDEEGQILQARNISYCLLLPGLPKSLRAWSSAFWCRVQAYHWHWVLEMCIRHTNNTIHQVSAGTDPANQCSVLHWPDPTWNKVAKGGIEGLGVWGDPEQRVSQKAYPRISQLWMSKIAGTDLRTPITLLGIAWNRLKVPFPKETSSSRATGCHFGAAAPSGSTTFWIGL